MSTQMPVQEGYVTFRGHKVWYRVVGGAEEPGRLPLLALHGGPGAPHDYLEPLETLAADGRRVIFYDQLGCGNSDQPSDPGMWTVELFLEELARVREALGLERLHVLGQSWGGMLGMEYALLRPAGLASITIADAPASVPHWASETNRLREALPQEVQRTLTHHEEAGTTADPAYQEAMLPFYARHVCRLDPWPDYVQRAFGRIREEVYNTMWGPSEFRPTGSLKDWDITGRLGEIAVPALVLSGRYDEATPAIAEEVHRGIRDSEWVLFEESSHMPHAEEPERYHRAVADFLSRVEQNRA